MQRFFETRDPCQSRLCSCKPLLRFGDTKKRFRALVGLSLNLCRLLQGSCMLFSEKIERGGCIIAEAGLPTIFVADAHRCEACGVVQALDFSREVLHRPGRAEQCLEMRP